MVTGWKDLQFHSDKANSWNSTKQLLVIQLSFELGSDVMVSFWKMLFFISPVTGLIKRELSLENVEAKILRHGDAVLKSLQELKKLSVSQQNHKRANLFYRFVTGLRSLHNSTLGPMVPKLMETSRYFIIICWLIVIEPCSGNK